MAALRGRMGDDRSIDDAWADLVDESARGIPEPPVRVESELSAPRLLFSNLETGPVEAAPDTAASFDALLPEDSNRIEIEGEAAPYSGDALSELIMGASATTSLLKLTADPRDGVPTQIDDDGLELSTQPASPVDRPTAVEVGSDLLPAKDREVDDEPRLLPVVEPEEATEEEEATGASEEAPAASEEAPAQSEEAPTQSEEAPAASEEAPMESEEASAASEEAPAESEEAPTESEEAPTESEEAPPKSEAAPVLATAEVVELPRAPDAPDNTTRNVVLGVAAAAAIGLAAWAASGGRDENADSQTALASVAESGVVDPGITPASAAHDSAAGLDASGDEPDGEMGDARNSAKYREAAETYASSDGAQAAEALATMTIEACTLDDGPRARTAFRKLVPTALRRKAYGACKKTDVDVRADVKGSTPPELVRAAQRSLDGGEARLAFDTARAANRMERSSSAVLVMGLASCALSDEARAIEMTRHLSKADRVALVEGCAEAGISIDEPAESAAP